MKRLYLTALFILCILLKSFSQTLSLSEMEKVLVYNISDFEDYVTAKGFKFSETYKNNDKCDVYVFSFDRNTANDNAKSFINLIICSSTHKVQQQFSDDKKYLEFKKLAKTSGYKYYNSRSENGTIVSEYYSPKYSLLLASKKANTGITIYGVSFALIEK